MARRHRRRRRGPRDSTGVQLIQILGLVMILVMIILFRDEIAGGAGKFFDNLGTEDVTLPEETPDAGATAAPGSPSDAH